MTEPEFSEADALQEVETRVLGVRVHAVTRGLTVAWIDAWIQAGTRAHLATVNPEFVMRTRQDARFRSVLERTRLNVADGTGIVLATRLRGRKLPERVTGADLIEDLAALGAERGWRILLVGGGPGVAESAARRLHRTYPNLPLPAAHVGSPRPADDAGAQQALKDVAPQLVLVAYGAPQQELWIDRNLPLGPPAVAIGVGGALDYLAGRLPRAPRLLRTAGLEWAYRLWRQPARMRRMRVLPSFAWLALVDALRTSEPS